MADISYSPVESRRFNLNIFRGQADNIDVEELKKIINNNKVDILIIRYPGCTKSEHHKLTGLGFNCLHADSLVCYSVDLLKYRVPPLKNDLKFEIITEGNSNFLKEMIPIILHGYQNHYFSNPYLDRKKIVDGYVEWGCSHTGKNKNKISWYAIKNGVIAGFASCSFDEEKKESRIILNGVLPQFSGNGIYSDLVRYMQSYFLNSGFNRMTSSTQLQNYSVQKVWRNEGFFLFASYDTYHINSFLLNPLPEKSNF